MSSLARDAEDASLRTVTISDLPPEATDADVDALFDELGPAEVVLPVESRRKKHVGIAFALLPDRESAQRAARALQGWSFRAALDPSARKTKVSATLSGEPLVAIDEEPASKAVSWKGADELWEVQMYNKDLSVDEGSHVQMGMLPEPSEADRSEFKEAARREREREREQVNKAATGAMAL
jgi:RNA recognition motif-containing protein